MRNLTIKRTKSFVACLAKMKVYIEDPNAGVLKIGGVACRKLGDLKNGEEMTFQIGDEAAKVFVIADQLSKNYCNEYYQLSEGTEDISLSGKNKFNPASGNAFCFDNNDNQEVVANRKRNTKKGLVVLICAVVVGAIIGFLLSSGLLFQEDAKPQSFSASGMTITLTDEFRKSNIGDFTAAYGSKDVAVYMVKENFSLMEGFEDYTLDQYLDLVLQVNNLTDDNVKQIQGLTCFVYEFKNPNTNKTYRYYSYVYKADDAFWQIQFAVLSEKGEQYEPQITEWAKSVSFSS